MAVTVTSAGTASGLDFESIITASVEAKRTSFENTTTVAKEEANIELSGVSQLKSALETFQEAIQAITDEDAFNAYSVTTDQTDTTYFTVSADDDVSSMTLDVIVEQLASSEKISKTLDITEDTNSFQAGTITFSLGYDEDGNEISFSVDIDEGDTLELIRRKINENDYGLTANYVKTDSGYILTIDTNTTGDSNTNLKITTSPTGDSDVYQSLDLFDFSGGSTEQDGTQINDWTYSAPQNAVISVDGQKISSDTNTFEDQISGITLTVQKVSATDDDGNYIANTITVSQDYDAVATKMQEFVDAYNTLMSTMDELYERNTYTDGSNNYDGGDLAGNATLKALQNTIKNIVSSAGLNSSGTSIYSMGLSYESDGTLSLDSDTFKESLADNFNVVWNTFTGTEGILKELDVLIEEYTQTAGILDEWMDSLNSEISSLEQEESDNETYLEEYEAALRAKYAALDTYIASVNSALDILLSSL